MLKIAISPAARFSLFTAILLTLLPTFSTAEPLAAELLARKPEFTSVQISPEGESVAYLRINDEDLMSLEVMSLSTGQKQGVAGTENFDVGGFAWIDETQLAVILTKDKLYAVGIYVYDRESGRLAAITELGQGTRASIVSVPENRENRLIASTMGENGVLLELATNVDLKNSRFGSNVDPIRRSYAPPRGRIQGYTPDVTGEPVMSIVYDDGASRGHVLDRETETWTELPLDLEETPMLAIAADQRQAWIARRTENGGTALHTYDLVDHTFGPEVYADPDYDLGTAQLILSQDGSELLGLSYNKVRRHTVWFDDELKATHEKLTAALTGYDVALSSRSRDGNRLLFRAFSSTEPGQYFLADLEASTIQHLAAASPWLEGIPLSPMASFDFTARDGLKLQAYLTLPTTEGATRPYPLMVVGHGGPWARDTWNFSGEVQFLASRGFAVLQPNYRGSTGFNYDITIKDRFDFRKMHDDVTDAVNALVRGGIADPEKLGIMGASFGGYLAIAGAAWEPDLYKVAITNVGVFDWDMLIADSRRESYIRYDWMVKNVGNDPEAVERFSPMNQVDDIKIPIFIAHGRQDIRVDISQSIRLERALKSRGVPHETYYEGDSAHGFASADAQAAYLAELEAFLDKHFF
jgi:dipeptidyl aminopeptidase/acylaminoacyl peptidase